MKIVSVVGTRPNFIKEYAIEKECGKLKINKVIVHTGQHYDFLMSDIFFRELSLPKPKYINVVKKESHGKETAAMLSFLEEVLKKEKPDVTLVYGDVNSTLAGALASVKLRIPVVHVEAGIRSYSKYNPEEINRRIVDCISDTLFAATRESYENLIKEGHPKKRVYLVGDIVKDSLEIIIKKFNIKINRGTYNLVTIHRMENITSNVRLKNIVEALIESKQDIKFPLHPNTEKYLKNFNLLNKIKKAKTIELLPPLGYIEFMKVLAGANKVLTDSGGVRREAYLLRKPIISLIDIVWFPDMIKCGWKYIAGDKKRKILQAIANFNPQSPRPNIFGNAQAAVKILSIIKKRYGKR